MTYRISYGNKPITKSPEYYVWGHMIQRCTNPNVWNYKNYGGRGIRVCAKWRHSFEQFLLDVGQRPNPNFSLDRIDNEGNYEPNNVRWTSRIIQSRNRRHYKNSSVYKGVHWYPHKNINKWQVTIGVNRKLKSIGYFEDLDEAISARLTAESIYW